MNEREFKALAASVDRTGYWPDGDRRGALNFLTTAAVSAAVSTVSSGVVISCADRRLASRADWPHFSLDVTTEASGSWLAVNETISYDQHGPNSMTHLDALGHFLYDGKGYTSHPAKGSEYDVVAPADGIVGRGVFLDLPQICGVQYLEPTALVTLAQVHRRLDTIQVDPRPGDILFVRTGRPLAPRPAPLEYPKVGGLDLDCARWMHDTRFSLIVSDAGLDTSAAVVDDVATPWHVLTLSRMGVPLIDMADLEQLAAECRRRGRHAFLAMIGALPLRGATASLVNPLAVF